MVRSCWRDRACRSAHMQGDFDVTEQPRASGKRTHSNRDAHAARFLNTFSARVRAFASTHINVGLPSFAQNPPLSLEHARNKRDERTLCRQAQHAVGMTQQVVKPMMTCQRHDAAHIEPSHGASTRSISHRQLVVQRWTLQSVRPNVPCGDTRTRTTSR